MSNIAVFPGQGSQTIGMGMEVSKKIKSAKNVLGELNNGIQDARSHVNSKLLT